MMILVYASLLLIIIALILGRNLNALSRLPYKGGWMLGFGVLALFVLQGRLVIYQPGQAQWQIALLMASQIALFLAVLLNHHLSGAKLFALGVALNTLVMAANGGWMPVSPQADHFVHPERTVALYDRPANSKNIILPPAETSLIALSDAIPLNLIIQKTVVSIGDVLMVIALAQFLFQPATRRPKANLDKQPEYFKDLI